MVLADHFAQATYASFGGSGKKAGWQVGPTSHTTQRELELLKKYAPTHLIPVEEIDDFLKPQEISRLPHRFEYRPVGEMGLYLHSVPAGKDTNGRPGNVFTHALIEKSLLCSAVVPYPILLHRSPGFLSPFRTAEVNAVQLPAISTFFQVNIQEQEMQAQRLVSGVSGDRTEVLALLQDVIIRSDILPVIAAHSDREAALWILALSLGMSSDYARNHFHFSTFERVNELEIHTWNTDFMDSRIAAIPRADIPLASERAELVLIDPERELPSDPYKILEHCAADNSVFSVLKWLSLSGSIHALRVLTAHAKTVHRDERFLNLIGIWLTLECFPEVGLGILPQEIWWNKICSELRRSINASGIDPRDLVAVGWHQYFYDRFFIGRVHSHAHPDLHQAISRAQRLGEEFPVMSPLCAAIYALYSSRGKDISSCAN